VGPGPFKEKAEGTGITSDIIKVKGGDPAIPGYYNIRDDVKLAEMAGLSIPRLSVRFWQKPQKPQNSNLHGFELHRPSSKGTKMLFQVIKAIINKLTKS